tara:strand:+ start:365 stop:571 length:207 start_codon:yes stop_codon:yes gene_type:complete
MTAIQILEKLGANASFNPSHLNEEDKLGIQQTLSDTKPFNAIQSQTPPDEEEIPEENQDDEKNDEKES